MIWDEVPLCTRDGHKVSLLGGSAIFLNVRPTKNEERLTQADLEGIVRGSLRPFDAPPGGQWSELRSKSGAGTFLPSSNKDPRKVAVASMITRDRSLHGISFEIPGGSPTLLHVREDKVSKSLTDAVNHFLDLARDELDLEAPLQGDVGLQGVKNFVFQKPVQPTGYGYIDAGQIREDRVEGAFNINSYEAAPSTIISTFLKSLHRAAEPA